MEVAGYLAAVLIGISLGLVGGGGSVLTVPVLYYLFGIDALTATAWSLFIVGVTSSIGSVTYFRKKEIDIKTAVIFGLPSVAAVFATRAWLLPALPDPLLHFGDLVISKPLFLLLLFAVLMLLSAYGMIRKEKSKEPATAHKKMNYVVILLEGTVVGTLTGLVGAGGGFLIVPALVLLSGLPMKKAIGTSLLIIAAKSLAGFLAEAGDVGAGWPTLLAITGCAIAGVFAGNAIGGKIDGNKLKPFFGWFVLAMGIYIIIRELITISHTM